MTTVAVIQPYFYPYAGYFRLFSAADVVVMFDCVQFPRRGWVHRNRFALANGELDWLTLPLTKAPQDVRIDQLRFAPDARARLDAELNRFPALARARANRDPLIDYLLAIDSDDVAGYLCSTVATVTRALGIERRMLRSSSLGLDDSLRGQDRVLAIVQTLNGSRYVNPSGGRELYDHRSFESAGLELRFLSEFSGPMESILSRMLVEAPAEIRSQILTQTILEA